MNGYEIVESELNLQDTVLDSDDDCQKNSKRYITTPGLNLEK